MQRWTKNFSFAEPLGDLGVEVSEKGVSQIVFGGFAKPSAEGISDKASEHLAACEAALKGYASGEKRVKRPKFDLEGTDFRKSVWKTLAKQGWGKTLSYGELAMKAGVNPAASRAVGSAMANNPIPVLIPCHRVLAANQKIGGFTGGTYRKRALLEHEGAFFKESRKAS